MGKRTPFSRLVAGAVRGLFWGLLLTPLVALPVALVANLIAYRSGSDFAFPHLFGSALFPVPWPPLPVVNDTLTLIFSLLPAAALLGLLSGAVGAGGTLWAGAALGGVLLALFALVVGEPAHIVAAILLAVVGAIAGSAVAYLVRRGQSARVLREANGRPGARPGS